MRAFLGFMMQLWADGAYIALSLFVFLASIGVLVWLVWAATVIIGLYRETGQWRP